MAIFRHISSNYRLRPLLGDDAALLQAETGWPREWGIPRPTWTLHWRELVQVSALEVPDPGDAVLIDLLYPQNPDLVARLSSIRLGIWANVSVPIQNVIPGWGASFQQTSGDFYSTIPLRLQGRQTDGGAEAPVSHPFIYTPGGVALEGRIYAYTPDEPLDPENEDTFREMSRPETYARFMLDLQLVNTAAVNVLCFAQFILWPEKARRLGVLRVPELYHG